MAAENGQASAVGTCLTCGLRVYAYPKPKAWKIEQLVILLVYTCEKRPTFYLGHLIYLLVIFSPPLTWLLMDFVKPSQPFHSEISEHLETK